MGTTQEVITLSMPHMIDLALISPEVGAVNFNLLHNLLHIMIQQLQMTDTNVEFRGKDGEKIKTLLTASKDRPKGVLLTEYNITADDKGQKIRTEVTNADGSSKKGKDSKVDQKAEVVVLIEPDDKKMPQLTVCLSQKMVTDIQEDIANLKQNVMELVDLPKNCNLLDALKNKDKPLVEMIQILSLSKRADAAESGLEKLASLVEDLTEEIQYVQLQNEDGEYDEQALDAEGLPLSGTSATARRRKQVGGDIGGKEFSQEGNAATKTKSDEHHPAHGRKPDLLVRLGNSEKRLQAVEDTLRAYGIPLPIVPEIQYPSRIDLPPIDMNKPFLIEGQSPDGRLTDVNYAYQRNGPPSREEIVAGRLPLQNAADGTASKSHTNAQSSKKDLKREEDIGRLPTAEAIAVLYKDVNKIKKDIRKLKSSGGGGKGTDESTASSRADTKRGRKSRAADESQLVNLEAKVKDSAESLLSMDQNFNSQIISMQNQFSTLELEVNNILERLSVALPGGDSGVESFAEILKKMDGMQIDIENIAEKTTNLIDDIASKKSILENLNETVELLKTIKADKEDLEDALADKADKCAINRKVSHDQFDTACDELSRGIEEALEKLTTQELLWQQALDEIQFEISNKLDKMELGPLRDFINNKLRMLQERMKSLSALKKEQEAAGTKSKFLRNVNCISCDKDVIMRKQMDASLMPQPRALPPNRSMAPYLAYELDALRKQQKTLANSRNLNHFENAISGGKSPRMDDHVCNRYCGGSHTVTTPQQRVTRMGHFLAQWGPGAVPATDTVPTKEEPKQDKKSALIEQSASADKNKSAAEVVPEIVPEVVPQKDKKFSKGSIRSGSATKIGSSTTTEVPKAPVSPSAGGSGHEKVSVTTHDKVKSPSVSGRSSQNTVKKSLKGSIGPSIKSKQVRIPSSKEAVSSAEKPKDIPVEIPEETPSEVAATEASPAKEPSEKGADGVEESPPSMANEEQAPPVAEEESKPEAE